MFKYVTKHFKKVSFCGIMNLKNLKNLLVESVESGGIMKNKENYRNGDHWINSGTWSSEIYKQVKLDNEEQETIFKMTDFMAGGPTEESDTILIDQGERKAEGLDSNKKKVKGYFQVKRWVMPHPGILKTYWMSKPFLKKRCLTVLSGPAEVGKVSLAVSLSLNNIRTKPLWPGGPIGNKKGILFFGGGCIDPDHVAQKIRGQQAGIKIYSRVHTERFPLPGGGDLFAMDGIGVKAKDNRFCINDILKMASVEKPAFVFFDYSLVNLDGWSPYLFNIKVFGLDTVFVALAENPTLLKKHKTIPHLHLAQKGAERFLTKPSGFADCPKGVLRFKLEHEKDRFVVQGLKYSDSCMLDKTEESQADRFKKILDKRKAEGKVMRTSEIKAEARKGGISTYFLQNLQWIDYGYQTKGEGYGSNFKQVLMPVERH